MPWVPDPELNREAEQWLSEPARVQLAICGKQIFQRASHKDYKVEIWLQSAKLGVAG